jgi:hypothetical protein
LHVFLFLYNNQFNHIGLNLSIASLFELKIGITGYWYHRNEGLYSPETSGTFLVQYSSYYYIMLEILLGKLSKSLYDQVLVVDFII